MNQYIKKSLSITSKIGLLLCMSLFVSCGSKDARKETSQTVDNQQQIMIAAAASMEKVINEIIETYKKVEPNVVIEGVYDSSGKLQIQIEQGLDVDIFISAATKQMDTLVDKGLIHKESVIPLLENRLVLIGNKHMTYRGIDFANVMKSESIAIGDPESVPAGIYGKELFTNLGIYDEVSKKASFGTNVTEVLYWVAEGSAEIGVVYKTDAISSDNVIILDEARDELLQTPIIYPMAILKASENKKAVNDFTAYIQNDVSKGLLEEAGFLVK